MTVRTRDYDGPRSLDPQCAPDEVDTVTVCQCLGCMEEWLKTDRHTYCHGCAESVDELKAQKLYREKEVPA